MRYTTFEINKYRAIDYAKVAVSNSLIPIIGVNESGKTTVLHAILAFDKSKDKYNDGLHLIHKNRYEVGTIEGSVIASILIETTEEVDKIAKELNLKVGDDIHEKLKNYQKEAKVIQIARNFPSKKYEILNSDLKNKDEKGTRLANALISNLPFILYFDDFSDRVPSSVTFNINNDEVLGYTIPKNQNIEWNQIIEEIFTRSSESSTLTQYIKTKDEPDQVAIINDIQDDLQKEVVEDWKNLKRKFGSDIGEESEDLQLKLEAKIADDKKTITFAFKVEDRTTGKGRDFIVTERSKGFQWFFNFIMKLKYNPKYKSDLKGAIYLLDEPGSYLHNSAQTELLKKLKDISKTNSILYCTHSEYLLDPDEINIANIKIAQKDSGKIKVLSFDNSGEIKTDGAFAPLYKALHMKSGFFDKGVNYPVITEGITEFYLFRMVAQFKEGFFNDQINFIPGAGATCLKDLISNAIAFSKRYIVLLDSDEEGRKAFETYRGFFGEAESNNFFTLKTTTKATDAELEDILSESDKQHLLEITGVNNVKTALPILYYLDETSKKKFIEKLDQQTISNLNIIAGKLNSLIIT